MWIRRLYAIEQARWFVVAGQKILPIARLHSQPIDRQRLEQRSNDQSASLLCRQEVSRHNCAGFAIA